MKTLYLGILVCLYMLVATDAAAQGRIDRVISELENKPDVETTYTERRTAKKHKLYRITTILTFKKDDYYNRAARAFESERSESVSAVKSTDMRKYMFENDKGSSTYILSRSNGVYTLVKKWRSDKDDEGDDDSAYIIINPHDGTTTTTYNCNGGQITVIESDNGTSVSVSGNKQYVKNKKSAAKAKRKALKESRKEARRAARQQALTAKNQRKMAKQQQVLAEQQRFFAEQQQAFAEQHAAFAAQEAAFARQKGKFEQQQAEFASQNPDY